MSRWPSVELVYLPGALDQTISEDVRAAADVLERHGVPKAILNGRYRACETITQVSVNGRSFLQFGSALGAAVCMEVSSGWIVTLMMEDSSVRFVNSSLEKFIETARGVTSRFPFYGEDDPQEMVDQAANDVAEAVRSVEERAFERDGFWSVLVDDIQMGDFVTEWITREPENRP